MSKGHSGLFSGTRGDIIASKTIPSFLKEEAFKYALEIQKNGTKAEKMKLNTVTIVYDEENNKYFYGMNGGIELHNAPKNVILFGDEENKGILPKISLNNFPIGNCSEIDAINNALNAGARLENLNMATLDVRRKNIRNHNIIGKCSCENCTFTFRGRIKNNNTGWMD